ncbi:unnamed protein product [Hermetia illucens]|uniref:Ig-like domain-containing protein n=1 Tax=Hermetia illucens TaxID=343691 RepID=A0A7R8YWM1_HERIL|nr:unnamed protein product [Hermetia illucens]
MDNFLSIRWILLGLLIIFKDTQSHSRYTENYIEEDKFLPNFVTLGQKYSIAVGSTVVLPCKINETEHSAHYVLAWKRDIAVLTAGTVKLP